MPSASPTIEIVTATVDAGATQEFWSTWQARAARPVAITTVKNGGQSAALSPVSTAGGRRQIISVCEPLGTVPAFAKGVAAAGADVIACIHDDVAIEEEDWDLWVSGFFETQGGGRNVGLVGFGGALAVGEPGMYDRPYDPMTLARHGFMSNMRHAEAHGRRVVMPRRVAVLDGFSLIGRREFMQKAWAYLDALGIKHHAYDVALCSLAKRWGYETWLVPVACHHVGGRTAVANREYAEWALRQTPGGDADFWKAAHAIVYDEFRDVLPFGFEEER